MVPSMDFPISPIHGVPPKRPRPAWAAAPREAPGPGRPGRAAAAAAPRVKAPAAGDVNVPGVAWDVSMGTLGYHEDDYNTMMMMMMMIMMMIMMMMIMTIMMMMMMMTIMICMYLYVHISRADRGLCKSQGHSSAVTVVVRSAPI